MNRFGILTAMLCFCFFTARAEAAKSDGSSSKKGQRFSAFDGYVGAKVAAGYGDYEMGELDNGSFLEGIWGLRLGVKLGPLIVGGEYMEGGMTATSKKEGGVASADRQTHPLFDDAKNQNISWNFGLMKGRLLALYSFSGGNKIRLQPSLGMSHYNFDYQGSSSMVELNIRLVDELYLGAYWRMQKFDKYSSTRVTPAMSDEPLNPATTTDEYGLTLSVWLPFSNAAKLGKWTK
ncbi:MAG TPA: hypothetical protein PKC28_04940 [Bdellovibrionales bacterium]|nr:hypothetical protein [Bdellovibrionales bacterium]